MRFEEYRRKRVQVTLSNGHQLTGKMDDYAASIDNGNEGRYLIIRLEEGMLKDIAVAFYEKEIKTIDIL